MKSIIIIILTLISVSVSAQFKPSQISFTKVDFHETVVIKVADSVSVDKAFTFLDGLCKGTMWYMNRVVVKNGVQYIRFNLSIHPHRTYLLEGEKVRRIKA